MQRDFLMTIGGIAATGAIVFGCGLFVAGSMMGGGKGTTGNLEHTAESHESKTQEKQTSSHGADEKEAHGHEGEKHGEDKAPAAESKHGAAESGENKHAEEKGSHGGHGDKHGTTAPTIDVDNTEELDQFILRYNDLSARGKYDDARVIALKAYALSGQKDAAWLRRLADATYLSDSLPAQQRYTKAYENYSALLINADSKATDREWSQYRATLCLRQMGRWDDALEASKTYLAQYADSSRRAEVRLMYAQGLFALGQRAEAREEIEAILKSNPPADIRAKALLELAQIDSERARVEPAEAPIKVLSRAEVVPLDEPTASVSPEELTGMPAARWQAIIQLVKAGKMDDAHQLLDPLLKVGSPLNAEQRARVALNFAKLLRDEHLPQASR